MEYALECSEAKLLEDIHCLTSFSEFHKPKEVKLVPNTYGRGGKIPALHEIRMPRKFTDYRSYIPPEKGRGRGNVSKTSRMKWSYYQEDTYKDPFTFNKSIEAECRKDSVSHTHYLYSPLTSHSELPPAIPPTMPCKDQKLHQTREENVISKSSVASRSSSLNEIHNELCSTLDYEIQSKTEIKGISNSKRCDDQGSEKVLKHTDNDYKEENCALNHAKAVFSLIKQSDLYEKVPFSMEAYENDTSFLSPHTFVLTRKQEGYPLFSGSISIDEQHLSIKNDNPLTSYDSECVNDGLKPDLGRYSTWSEIAEDSNENAYDMNFANQLEEEFDIDERYKDNEKLDKYRYNSNSKLYSFDDSNSFQSEKYLTETPLEFELKTEEFPSLKAFDSNNKNKNKKHLRNKKSLSLMSLAKSLVDGSQNKDVNQNLANSKKSSSKRKNTYIDIKNFSPGTSKGDVYDYIKDFGDIQRLKMIPDVDSTTARVWMKDSTVAEWIAECLKDEKAPLGDRTRSLETVVHSDS